MHYVGIDLHRRTLVIAVENNEGPVGKARSFACHEVSAIRRYMEELQPFRAVIEASSSYRWLHEMSAPLGKVMRRIVGGRAPSPMASKATAVLRSRVVMNGRVNCGRDS